jgi:hypothetical protein
MPIGNAPDAPAGLTATKGVGQVSLDWNDNSEPDFAGYNVYRGTASGGPYSTKVNSSLITNSNYIDSSVVNGTTYYYVVTAVNNAAQESGNSNQASARPVGPPATLLNDSFEGSPWNSNWDDNSTGSWTQSSTQKRTGTYSAYSANKNKGAFTTDNLNAYAGENLTVSFWYRGTNISGTDVVVNVYNGTSYVQIGTLSDTSGAWVQFKQTFTYAGAPQYFITNFRLQLVSTIGTGNKTCFVDDVVITINQ